MDVCHLLLGRPWQYDPKVIYDGFKNTYTFHNDGHKIILAPMKPIIALETKLEVKRSLLSKFELEKEIKASLDVMALVVVEEIESEKEIPQEVKSILEEVVDALSRKHALLTSMLVKVVGLEMVKDLKFRVKGIKMLHRLKTKEKYVKCVEQTNKHKKLLEFEVEDVVWVHINTDRFLAWKFGRLKSMVDVPFNIIEKIGENAYNLELLDNSYIFPTSNVKDLKSYQGEDLKASFFSQLWGIDARASTTNIGNSIFFMKNSYSRGCETLETPNLFLNPSIVSLVIILIWSCFIIERFVLQVQVVVLYLI